MQQTSISAGPGAAAYRRSPVLAPWAAPDPAPAGFSLVAPAPASAVSGLLALVAAQSARSCPAALAEVVDAVAARFGASLDAVLFYGSCLRSADPSDGLVDVYALVDDYRRAYRQRRLRWFNRVLAPNVFYLECPHARGVLRIKCTVLTLAAFDHGVRHWFHSYLWGRFAQPVRLVFARNADVRDRVAAALAGAVLTFARRAAACRTGAFSTETLWLDGLRRSYRAELRVEGVDRARELVRADPTDYRLRMMAAAVALGWRAGDRRDEYRVATATPGSAAWARFGWAVRTWQGRVLSILRLVKATMTFRGGIDYAAWKLERHTGIHVTVTPRLRRHPLVYVWPLLARLMWKGALH